MVQRFHFCFLLSAFYFQLVPATPGCPPDFATATELRSPASGSETRPPPPALPRRAAVAPGPRDRHPQLQIIRSKSVADCARRWPRVHRSCVPLPPAPPDEGSRLALSMARL